MSPKASCLKYFLPLTLVHEKESHVLDVSKLDEQTDPNRWRKVHWNETK